MSTSTKVTVELPHHHRDRQGREHERHAERADDIQRAAAVTIDGPERDRGEGEIHQADDEGRQQRRVEFPARRLEDGRRIVDDGIDAREVNQDRKPEAHDHGAPYTGPQQVAPVAPLRRKAGGDLGHGKFRRGAAAAPLHDGEGFVTSSLHHQEARRFRGAQQQDEEHHRGDHAGDEHPAPVVGPEIAQQIVDAVRDQDAGDDRHLVERAEPPAQRGRRDLRNVHRRSQRNRADREAAEEARRQETLETPGQASGRRGEREQHRHPQQDAPAAVAIGDSPGNA